MEGTGTNHGLLNLLSPGVSGSKGILRCFVISVSAHAKLQPVSSDVRSYGIWRCRPMEKSRSVLWGVTGRLRRACTRFGVGDCGCKPGP